MKIIQTRSSLQTQAAAKRFSKSIKPGSVILLEGDLGSGKTTFVKGLAEGFGIKSGEHVTSPTFVIMRVYRGKIPIYHFDLYRLESETELEAIGFEEFINDTNAVSCVEWPEKAGSLIPADALRVRFQITGKQNERTITLPDGE
jgi:tRNA threonylcarbamoyladenosine biosynthesis protein TsaE